jgi:hypothetical protein
MEARRDGVFFRVVHSVSDIEKDMRVRGDIQCNVYIISNATLGSI